MKAPIEDKEITSLYQSDATEVPSSELDENILSYAKSQTVKKRNWWPQVGLAASVVFVAILAPWEWLERDQIVEMESNSYLIKPEKVLSEPVRKKATMRGKSNSESMDMLMKSAPPVALTEKPVVSGLADNPFAEIELQLKAGNKEQARLLLVKLLLERPELNEQLPDKLKILKAETTDE